MLKCGELSWRPFKERIAIIWYADRKGTDVLENGDMRNSLAFYALIACH